MSGQLYGGNLCTLNLLQGTAYMPDLSNCILFLEDDELVNPAILHVISRHYCKQRLQLKDWQ